MGAGSRERLEQPALTRFAGRGFDDSTVVEIAERGRSSVKAQGGAADAERLIGGSALAVADGGHRGGRRRFRPIAEQVCPPPSRCRQPLHAELIPRNRAD